MWWFLLIIIAVAVYWLFLRKKPSPKLEPPPAPTPKFTISVETRTSKRENLKIGYKPTGVGGFVIGPDFPFPVTLLGLDESDVAKLAKAFEQQNDYELWAWFTHVVAQKNVQCKELDAWIMEAKPKVEAGVERLIATSSEWTQSSDLDKEDLLADMRHVAVSELKVRPADLDVTWTLLFDEPHDLTVDDALLARFKETPETYQLLLRVISVGSKVQTAQAGDYRRKAFDELYEKGFMLRGKEIALEDILTSMTMKQMQDIAGADAPKKFTRKAHAVELLKELPDIWQRLEKVMSFRELFQIKPIAGVDVDELAKAHAYSSAVARVVLRTIRASVDSQRLKRSSLEDYAEGWKLYSEDCCPSCQTMHGNTWKRLPKNLPPFHLGCEAQVHMAQKSDIDS